MRISGAVICRMPRALPSLGLALALASLAAPGAEARHFRHHRYGAAHAHTAAARHHEESLSRHKSAHARSSNIAAIVVDANTGRTLYARNENEQRYPASITKVMTLYLLFEQIDRGTLKLDSTIRISAHAAAQKPTKLGLRPGQTISVEDAIKAAVTRSANDIAVAIAETIAGDEENFARLMTAKAHALGMSGTHFVNASGLPDPEQLTTAHDLALLGRAIEEHFPRYYRYFATRAFYYHGATIANHNHLLDRVEGMDGIKTGYTNASGFNLLTSVKRGGHYIVAVVLGGASAGARDRIMADLIEEQIENTSTIRTASAILAPAILAPAPPAPPPPAPPPQETPRYAEATGREHKDAAPRELPAKIGMRVPVPASTESPSVLIDPIRLASLNASVPPQKPRPAFVSGAPRPEAARAAAAQDGGEWRQANLDGSTSRGRPSQGGEQATATPSALQTAARPPLPIPAKITAATDGAAQQDIANASLGSRPKAAQSGWMIQIGATSTLEKADELIARAKMEGPRALARAAAFTEKIQKGSETYYRARFAGLEEESAALVCKSLKRSGFSCFTTRN
jgi:D-alanyl-D-alanine carboxypeptidase